MIDSPLHHDQVDNDQDDNISSYLEGLESPDPDERAQAGDDLFGFYQGKDADEIALRIEGCLDDPYFALLGWGEYCFSRGHEISLEWIQKIFEGVIISYKIRANIALFTSEGERKAGMELVLADVRERVTALIDGTLLQEGESIRTAGCMMRLKLMDIFEEDVERIQGFFDMCPKIVQDDGVVCTILAGAYERKGNYQKAYEIHHRLQVKTSEVQYLGAQIALLFRMGRNSEAMNLYRFGTETNGRGSDLLPLLVYRGTIEKFSDLEILYQSLLPLYKGARIDGVMRHITQTATGFILRKLRRIEKCLNSCEKGGDDIYSPRYNGLWVKKLFLLEVLVGMLGYTVKDPLYPEGVSMEFILTLKELYEEYKTGNTILEDYFLRYDQSWMEVVRDIHGDNGKIEDSEVIEESGEHDLFTYSDTSENATISPYSTHVGYDAGVEGVVVSENIFNILDFLRDRVEDDIAENMELLREILEFQNRLSVDNFTLPVVSAGDIHFAGDQINRAMRSLSEADRKTYRDLKEYAQREYGFGIFQFLFFLSSNASDGDSIEFNGMRKDPRVLLLVIVISLLGSKSIPGTKICEFIGDPIFEALDEKETVFLMRILYRSELFADVCVFMREMEESFHYPGCVEIYFLSLSHLHSSEQEEFIEVASDTIYQLFEYESFEDYFIYLKESRPDCEDSILHAELLYQVMTDEQCVVEMTPSNDTIRQSAKRSDDEGTMYTALRIMDVNLTQRPVWLKQLIGLYPFLGIHKQNAMHKILEWSFILGWREEIVKHLSLAHQDGIVTGYWIHAPLLLGSPSEASEGITAIAHDPLLYSIPDPIVLWIEKHFRNDLDNIGSSKLSPEQLFQVSYILAYTGDSEEDKLNETAGHFDRFGRLVSQIYYHTFGREDIFWEKFLDMFRAIDYTGNLGNSDQNSDETKDLSIKRTIANFLKNHLSEFRRSLVVRGVTQSTISQENIAQTCLQVYNSLRIIVQLFPIDSKEYTELAFMTEQFKNEGWFPVEPKPKDSIIDRSHFQVRTDVS